MLNLRNRNGHTLIEVLAVLGIMGFVGIGAMTLMAGSATCFDGSTTEAFTDTDAVVAMQMIVTDVREAKSIVILNNGPTVGKRLRVIPPARVTGKDYYDRHIADPSHQVEYYVSDSTGIVGRTGNWLWRAPAGGTKKPLKKDISEVGFELDTSRSVKITIVARNDAASGTKTTELTQRVVYLRNY